MLGSAAKPLFPSLIRQHGDQVGARLILFRRKHSSKGRAHLEHVEVAGGNPRTLHQLGVGVLAAEVEAAAVHDGNAREDILAFGSIGIIGRRQRDIA